ncbi:hypothetical protein A2962_05530 [Candidatus Woesebacteria bacterium RIFCSPLOWO2_01_FULL_39_61]|uniref:Uncharacterized protein n=2 Tax=Microgenomates group TaxID=1794810 RepID=A0A0H4T5E0_9BACT|nr:hypothetical protein [uncultured Microgenomates bacterium Rifle_16ft_4_minimus_37836]OGM28048.1 MAG: hypothetical protein A2692_05270 [Candidatus Woesebacteria bacterium RIFCSPHIGHO2_01_FULL_39_95]OGM34036.1 MAG: hypothetical protein A3D01_03840 [Candidatus Woesebacteria bacterium RIFCSPHIGHO2_02_FULL_39_13]OGM38294.1 MAG: hypothetical protein A3E13_05950 [Candidatus Woesebacteria bacterium RIFCSPHIGHO2_12_FULL_40_20]OGM67757.1 MAG: hypothetical protein A2962_05530 [Candidatus Woesebacteria 
MGNTNFQNSESQSQTQTDIASRQSTFQEQRTSVQQSPKLSQQSQKPARDIKLKRLLLWIIIAVVLLFSSTLGILAYRKYQLGRRISETNTSKSTSTITGGTLKEEHDTNTWREYSYKHPRLKYSFKYPSRWFDPAIAEEKDRDSVMIYDVRNLQEEGISRRFEIARGSAFDPELNRNMTAKELAEYRTRDFSVKISPYSVDSREGFRYTYQVKDKDYYKTEVIIADSKDEGILHLFIYRHSPDESDSANPDPKTLDSIISTFKFLE